jgi:hypothetical protein
MQIPTGDYLIEALDSSGHAIPGALYSSASYKAALARAGTLSESHGISRWRIMRCVATSDDKERWDVPADT